MYLVFLGSALFVLGALAASNSLHIVRRAVRVWPRELDHRSAEALASYEFLIRFIGILVSLAGIGLVLLELVES